MTPSPTERAEKEGRIQHLREKMEAGVLVPFIWATAQVAGSDTVFRMNGYHSSTMLSGLNGKFPEGLIVHLDRYEVDDEASLGSLFRQFDDRASSRSPLDVSHAYQGLHPAVRDLPPKEARIALEGCQWHDNRINGVRLPKGDDAFEWFDREAYHPFLRWVTTSVLSIKTPELKKKEVLAAMYATYVKNPEAAQTFWSDVARGGDEFNETAPATVLDAWLKAAIEERRLRESLDPADFYQACIYAWNAYRAGQPITKLKYDLRKGFADPAE
jgi:hypothetical protein